MKYDNSFRVISRVVNGVETVNIGYDSSASGGDTLISTYSYDANGNRIAHWTPTGIDSGTYDAQDRMLTYGGAQYFYTANGDLRMKITGTDTTRYTYDALGNLTQVVMPNGDVIHYVIDGQGRRIAKKVNGVIMDRWIYSGQLTPVAELDSAGGILTRFVGGYMMKDEKIYRLVFDQLGSIRLVVDVATGTVAQRIDYDEFGNVEYDSAPGFQPFGYGGGLYDLDTRIVRLGARDYDPETGRWQSKDPIRFLGGDPNLYSFVTNDPNNKVDPSGTCGCGGEDPSDPYAFTTASTDALSLGNSASGGESIPWIPIARVGTNAAKYTFGASNVVSETMRPASRIAGLAGNVSKLGRSAGPILAFAQTGFAALDYSEGRTSLTRATYRGITPWIAYGVGAATTGGTGFAVGLGFLGAEKGYDLARATYLEWELEFNVKLNQIVCTNHY